MIESGGGLPEEVQQIANEFNESQQSPEPVDTNEVATENPTERGRGFIEKAKQTAADVLRAYFTLPDSDQARNVLAKIGGPAILGVVAAWAHTGGNTPGAHMAIAATALLSGAVTAISVRESYDAMMSRRNTNG